MPHAANVAIYEDIYENVYLPYYKNNEDAFRVLNKYGTLEKR